MRTLALASACPVTSMAASWAKVLLAAGEVKEGTVCTAGAWQARGPKLTEHDRPTAVRVRYLLRPESEENAGRR